MPTPRPLSEEEIAVVARQRKLSPHFPTPDESARALKRYGRVMWIILGVIALAVAALMAGIGMLLFAPSFGAFMLVISSFAIFMMGLVCLGGYDGL